MPIFVKQKKFWILEPLVSKAWPFSLRHHTLIDQLLHHRFHGLVLFRGRGEVGLHVHSSKKHTHKYTHTHIHVCRQKHLDKNVESTQPCLCLQLLIEYSPLLVVLRLWNKHASTSHNFRACHNLNQHGWSQNVVLMNPSKSRKLQQFKTAESNKRWACFLRRWQTTASIPEQVQRQMTTMWDMPIHFRCHSKGSILNSKSLANVALAFHSESSTHSSFSSVQSSFMCTILKAVRILKKMH